MQNIGMYWQEHNVYYEDCVYISEVRNDDPVFCSVHRRSLLWWSEGAKHGTGL